jgi:CubicO group peptidase (beta-lactamase class C family)
MKIFSMLVFVPALSVSATLLCTVGCALLPEKDSRNVVRKTLDDYVLSNRISGVVSILSDANCNLTVDCSGWADVEKLVPISTNTLFAIFSMTKTLTGAAVMCAIDEGRMALDDKVSKYLPEYADVRMRDGSAPKRELVLRDILSHTDGMRWEYPLVNNDIPVREAAKLYAAKGMKYQPGETFAYGTMRFSVAAACLEVAVGERFEDYLKRKILDPLEMKDTTFSPNASQLERLVTAYTSNGLPLRLASDHHSRQLVFPKERPLCPAPGGGLFSTPADMIKFSQMLAHHGERKGVRVISRKTFDEIFAVVQVPGELGKENPYTVGAWVYGDWFGHEGAMRTDQRANLKTGQSRLFFIQTENKAGADFFALKKAWHNACDTMQGTKPTVFGH